VNLNTAEGVNRDSIITRKNNVRLSDIADVVRSNERGCCTNRNPSYWHQLGVCASVTQPGDEERERDIARPHSALMTEELCIFDDAQ
jgi:hypothetical protein